MIRITAIQDTLDDEGGCTLTITGHGSNNATGDLACARASALWHTFLSGYELMAKTYPKQVHFQKIVKKKPVH